MEATTTIEQKVNQKLQEQNIMSNDDDKPKNEVVADPENPGGNKGEMIENKTSDEDDSNSAPRHPLFMPKVLSKVMRYLRLCDLKVARRVCPAWKQAATPYFYNKAIAFLPEKYHPIPKSSYMEMGKTCQFEKHHFYNMPLNFFNYFARLTGGQRIKMMNLEYDAMSAAKIFNIRTLKGFLQQCPNLEELRCYCMSDLFMSETERLWTPRDHKFEKLKKVTFGGMNIIGLRILQDLFNSSPELKSFNLETIGPYNNEDGYIATVLHLDTIGAIDLSKLEVLNIYGETRIISSTQAMLQFPQINLNSLTSLQICLYCWTNPSAIQQMFEQLSGTLKEFKVTNYPSNGDFYNPLMIPVCMTKLEKLEVFTANNGFFMGPIESAVKLPNLKIFNMHRYPNVELGESSRGRVENGFIYNFDDCWSRLDTNWHTNRCNSLEFIRLPCGLSNPDIFIQIVTVFPNLRNMKIENPSPEVMTAIFTYCTNLERLSIRLVIYPKNIDSILTGLKPSWCKIMAKINKFTFADPQQVIYNSAGLKDMKNLKYFDLRQYKKSYRLSEVSLYNGFMHLTRAVQLDLQSFKNPRTGLATFSETSIHDLKETLGAACFVNIQDNFPEDNAKIMEKRTKRFWIDDENRYF